MNLYMWRGSSRNGDRDEAHGLFELLQVDSDGFQRDLVQVNDHRG